jgi:outer membrane protein OmpA-like peptidoglycan-associated protein
MLTCSKEYSVEKICFSLLLLFLFLTAGCALQTVQLAPSIDPNSPTVAKVHVFRNQTVPQDLDSDYPWVVGIDDRSLCGQLGPGQYTVLYTTVGSGHKVTAKRLMGWWHEMKEPFIAEPDTDYYFLTGVRDDSMFIEKIDAVTALAYMKDSSLVCSQPKSIKVAEAVPVPSPVAAPPPVQAPEEEPVVQPPPPAPAPEKTEPTGVKVEEIYFDFDKAEIKPEMRDDLDAVVNYLKLHPSSKIVLGGHASEEGTQKYNLALSKRRNDAVRAYLIQAGIKGDRIIEKAFGETRPEYSNTTEEGRAHNRRVEFHYVDGS